MANANVKKETGHDVVDVSPREEHGVKKEMKVVKATEKKKGDK